MQMRKLADQSAFWWSRGHLSIRCGAGGLGYDSYLWIKDSITDVSNFESKLAADLLVLDIKVICNSAKL